MSNKVARRCIDGTYDFLTLLVSIVIFPPCLVVITVISLVGAVLESFNQRGYLQVSYNDLDPCRDSYFGVGGTDVTSYEILNCRLLFVDDYGNQRIEELEYVVVNQHNFRSEEEERHDEV